MSEQLIEELTSHRDNVEQIAITFMEKVKYKILRKNKILKRNMKTNSLGLNNNIKFGSSRKVILIKHKQTR